jgi:DNA-binding transcriptional ArsR family regulator
MSEKYLMFSLDDAKTKSLADVLTNKTCKKILDYLAENEASETEIARDLDLPANTVNYNIKKLLKAGLIEKSKEFFWSVKGKKILRYKVANKKIVISPKSSQVKKVLASFFITAIVGLFVGRYYTNNSNIQGVDTLTKELPEASINLMDTGNEVLQTTGDPFNIGIWIIFGALFALVVYLILNWNEFQ